MVLHRKDPRHWNWTKSTLTNVMDLIIDVFALVYLSSRILGFSYLRSFLDSWSLFFHSYFYQSLSLWTHRFWDFIGIAHWTSVVMVLSLGFWLCGFCPSYTYTEGISYFYPSHVFSMFVHIFQCFIFFHYPCRYFLFFSLIQFFFC